MGGFERLELTEEGVVLGVRNRRGIGEVVLAIVVGELAREAFDPRARRFRARRRCRFWRLGVEERGLIL